MSARELYSPTYKETARKVYQKGFKYLICSVCGGQGIPTVVGEKVKYLSAGISIEKIIKWRLNMDQTLSKSLPFATQFSALKYSLTGT